VSKKSTRLIYLGILILLFFTGVVVRRAVLFAQVEIAPGNNLPFTLESALQFRLTERVYLGQGLPARDMDVQFPEGVNPRETYTIAAEYVYALMARICPPDMPLPERIRWAQLLWFCMGIPLLALWVYGLFGSRFAGCVAGAFYAVALSSVIRSTGQELSRENFALPLLIGHLAFDALARKQERPIRFWVSTIISAICLGAAAMSWDLIQFYVGLWALAGCTRVFRFSNHEEESVFDYVWLTQFMVLLLLSFLNPYMRVHLWWLSPGMLLSYGALLGMLAIQNMVPEQQKRWKMVLIMLLPVLFGLLLGHFYGHIYGHFSELLYAKVRFLNQKPVNPAVLTFAQRIMWVPALDSLTWGLTKVLFPAMLLFSLGAIGILLRYQRRQPKTGSYQLIFNYTASLVAFILFVRFHVFLAVFAAAIIGGGLARVWANGVWKRYLLAVVLALGWLTEIQHVLKDPWRWGRPGVYYEELAELTQWVKENAAPDAVLANFGVSASILTYGECPIVLHPKFESERIRERVYEYGKALFTKTEGEFRDWAEPYGAQYYVYALGEFSQQSPERQMRYFVNALEPPEDAAARIFEYEPYKSRYFKFLWGNRKYRVFEIITKHDQMVSAKNSQKAWTALEHGDLAEADELAIWALKFDLGNTNAMEVIRHVDSLYDQGFMPSVDEAQDSK